MSKPENKLTAYFQWACGSIIMRDGYKKAAWEQFVARDLLVSENLFVQWRTQAKRGIPELMRENSAVSKVMTAIGVAQPMGSMVRMDEEKWREFCVKVAEEHRELSEGQKEFAKKFSITGERKKAVTRNKHVTAPIETAQDAKVVAAPRLPTIETDLRAYPGWMLDKPCGRTSLREVLSLLETKYGTAIPQEVVTRLKPQIEALSKQGA